MKKQEYMWNIQTAYISFVFALINTVSLLLFPHRMFSVQLVNLISTMVKMLCLFQCCAHLSVANLQDDHIQLSIALPWVEYAVNLLFLNFCDYYQMCFWAWLAHCYQCITMKMWGVKNVIIPHCTQWVYCVSFHIDDPVFSTWSSMLVFFMFAASFLKVICWL